MAALALARLRRVRPTPRQLCCARLHPVGAVLGKRRGRIRGIAPQA